MQKAGTASGRNRIIPQLFGDCELLGTSWTPSDRLKGQPIRLATNEQQMDLTLLGLLGHNLLYIFRLLTNKDNRVPNGPKGLTGSASNK
jgi:hypothetical protein